MERKIVELLKSGSGVNQVVAALRISKVRVRRLRERAKEYGYLAADGKPGAAALPPYPETIFPDTIDGRALQVSEPQRQLEPHRAWIAERLQAGWHAVTVSEEVFDLMDRRRYNSSMILTSNRAVEEWGAVFPDPVVANATIDRIFDRAEVIEFVGKSYRLKRRIQEAGHDIVAETTEDEKENGEAS